MAQYASGERFGTVAFGVTQHSSGDRSGVASAGENEHSSGDRFGTAAYHPSQWGSGDRFGTAAFKTNQNSSGERSGNAAFQSFQFGSGERYSPLIIIEPFNAELKERMRLPLRFFKQHLGLADGGVQVSSFVATEDRGLNRLNAPGGIGNLEMTLPNPAKTDDVVGAIIYGGNHASKKTFVKSSGAHALIARGRSFSGGAKFQLATHGQFNRFFYLFEFDSDLNLWILCTTDERLTSPDIEINDALGTFECDPWGHYIVNMTTAASVVLPLAQECGFCRIAFYSNSANGVLTLNRKGSDQIRKEGTAATSQTWTPGGSGRTLVLESRPNLPEWHFVHDMSVVDRY